MAEIENQLTRRSFLASLPVLAAAFAAGKLPAAGLPADEISEDTRKTLQILKGLPQISQIGQHELEGAKTVVIHFKQRHLPPIMPKDPKYQPLFNKNPELTFNSQAELRAVVSALVALGIMKEFFVEGMDSKSLQLFKQDCETLKRTRQLADQLPVQVRQQVMESMSNSLTLARSQKSVYLPILEELNSLPGMSTGTHEPPYNWLSSLNTKYALNFHASESEAHHGRLEKVRKLVDDTLELGKKVESESLRLEAAIKAGASPKDPEMAQFLRLQDQFKRQSGKVQDYLKSREFEFENHTVRDNFVCSQIGEFAKQTGHSNRFIALIFGQDHQMQDDISAWNKAHPEDKIGLITVQVKSLE